MAKLKINATKIKNDIDAAIVKVEDESPVRTYLGMSAMGKPCVRYIWYQWRWAKIEKFSARMLRLFDRGHREEDRFVEWLRLAGYPVQEVDPKTKTQFAFSAHDGYVRGHSDGLITMYTTNKGKKVKAVCEFKTSNNKGFLKMQRAQSVQVVKYEHYCQMQRYMHEQQIEFGLYMMINKDNDAVYTEIIRYDNETVQFLYERELELLATKTPPTRISEDPSFWICSYCNFKGICFDGEKALKSCRMCKHINLPGEAAWECLHDSNDGHSLTTMEQQQGCKNYKEIKHN